MDFHDTQKRYVTFPLQNTWILISFDLDSVWTRQTSEEVAYKPGLDYLLECFLPSTFARIINVLPEKGQNFWNWVGGLQPSPPPWPVRLWLLFILWNINRLTNGNHYILREASTRNFELRLFWQRKTKPTHLGCTRTVNTTSCVSPWNILSSWKVRLKIYREFISRRTSASPDIRLDELRIFCGRRSGTRA